MNRAVMGDGTKDKSGSGGHPALHVAEPDTGAPRRGDVIAGKYTIKRLIGRGGMGDVYLASSGSDEPDLALKMLADRWLDDSDAVARFGREVSLQRSIEHPNIVALYDNGVHRGRPYLTMEYIDGEPLSDYLDRKGPLSLTEFVPIAAQMLKGMGHAHLRDMMIRDVKPSNIMLCTRKGRANFVKILDFGLAKMLVGTDPLTEGGVLGTAGYLAPEAIRGEPLDLRVDVYAIGVAFYHMLAGVLPFGGEQENATVLYRTLDEPPKPLEEVRGPNHDLPQGLLDLISDCLAKDREDRPADANIVVERLIDAVPVTYFRLPDATVAPRPPGFGNTGLIELVRANPSIRIPPGASMLPKPAPKKRPAKEWAIIAGIACLVSLVTVFAVSSLQRDDNGEDVAKASVLDSQPPASSAPAQTEPALTAPSEATAQPEPAPEPQPGPQVNTPLVEPAPSPVVDPAAASSDVPPAPAPQTRSGTRRRRSTSRNRPKRDEPTSAAEPSQPEAPPPTQEPAPPAAPAPAAVPDGPLQPASKPKSDDRGGVFMSAKKSDAKAKREGLLRPRD